MLDAPGPSELWNYCAFGIPHRLHRWDKAKVLLLQRPLRSGNLLTVLGIPGDPPAPALHTHQAWICPPSSEDCRELRALAGELSIQFRAAFELAGNIRQITADEVYFVSYVWEDGP